MGQQALQPLLEQLSNQLQEFDAHDLPDAEMRRAVYKLYEMIRAISQSLAAVEREFNDAFEAFNVLGSKVENTRSSNLISTLLEKGMEKPDEELGGTAPQVGQYL